MSCGSPRPAGLPFTQVKTEGEVATLGRRVPVRVLVLLVFPFNYSFIVVVPANYTAWAHAFDSAIWGS